MALLDPPKKLIQLIEQSRIHWRCPVIFFGIIAAITVSKPLLWPDGFGITADKSVTTTVEKDPQGKITKTVETTKTDRGKTLWDWLSLLGVPITLAILGYWLQQIQQKRAEEVAKDQRELAADETKEEVLQVYFDRLSVLLVDKNLRAIAAKINSEKQENTLEEQELLDSAVDVIRARTLSILRRFENDKERKTSVIRFLIEADFISKLKLNLSHADLSHADLRETDLIGADLRDADLIGAYFIRADLRDAKLSHAKLNHANLVGANLGKVNLFLADLIGADLSNANLKDANLSGADLSNANLKDVNLIGADLSNAIGLSPGQVQQAKRWEKAQYDQDFRKQLGLDAEP